MKKKDFINQLKEKTKYNIIGVITGTICPFKTEGLMSSDAPIEGFSIWCKENEHSALKIFKFKTATSTKDIILKINKTDIS